MNSELIERLREAGESAARIACRSVDPQPGLAANLVNEAADTLTTANETIARLEQQKADVTADYMRRHKDATDRFEEIIALKAQLATKEAELLACRADAERQKAAILAAWAAQAEARKEEAREALEKAIDVVEAYSIPAGHELRDMLAELDQAPQAEGEKL